MSNHSYSIQVSSKEELESLKAYMAHMSSISTLVNYAVADTEIKPFQCSEIIPVGSVFMNIIIDRANLRSSFAEEGFLELKNTKYLTLYDVRCKTKKVPIKELRASYEQFKDTWDFETFKQRYGTYRVISGTTYYDKEDDIKHLLK